MSSVERLAWEGFEVITPEQWASLIAHVKEKVEDHYWWIDGLNRQYTVPEFTICINRQFNDEESSSESETSSDFASDSE